MLNEKLQSLGFQPDTTVASNESTKKKGFWGSRDKKTENTKVASEQEGDQKSPSQNHPFDRAQRIQKPKTEQQN